MGLYQDVRKIARAIITDSKGIGYSSIDKDVVLADVERAMRVSEIADAYLTARTEKAKANEKIAAARLLELDDSGYILESEHWTHTMHSLEKKMEIIEDSCCQDNHGGWIVSGVVIPEL